MIRLSLFGVGVFSCFVAIAGCSPEAGPQLPPTYKVIGAVTLDGEPVQEGSIVFESEEDLAAGHPPGTADIKGGKYEANVSAGKKKVSIMAEKEIGPPDETGVAPTEEIIPAKYNENTTLECEVKKGENKFDFELESGSSESE